MTYTIDARVSQIVEPAAATAIPDDDDILNFRRLLERHDLTKATFAQPFAEHLAAKGELLHGEHHCGSRR